MTDALIVSNPSVAHHRTDLIERDPVIISDLVQRGDQRGRTIGFPTLNLPAPAAVAEDGVWAGWVRVGEDHRTITLAAAVSLGTRATFYSNGGERLVEAHLPAFCGDLYGQEVTVAMCAKLREQQVFGSVDDLVAQLRRDVDATLEWWRRWRSSDGAGRARGGQA